MEISASLHRVKLISDDLVFIFMKEYMPKTFFQNDIAYIIYTSGTTGNPKGAAIGRNALISLKESLQKALSLENGKKILSLADYSFDMFVPEEVPALSWGLTVIMADSMDVINPRRLKKLLLEYQPHYIQIIPSALKLLMLVDPILFSLKSVDKLILGAEMLPYLLFKKVKDCFHGEIRCCAPWFHFYDFAMVDLHK